MDPDLSILRGVKGRCARGKPADQSDLVELGRARCAETQLGASTVWSMVRGALALLAAGCVLCPSEAQAFCRTTNCSCASDATCSTDCPKDGNGCPSTGDPVAWSGGCAGFSLDLQGTSVLSADQWTDAIVQSFETWTTV